MKAKKISASIIMPAFNESDIISFTIKEIKEKLNNKIEAEIIVVDDGSADGTYLLAKEAGAKVIRLDVNHSYGYALKTGLNNASFGNIVIFGADGEFDPNDILKLLEIVDSKKAAR